MREYRSCWVHELEGQAQARPNTRSLRPAFLGIAQQSRHVAGAIGEDFRIDPFVSVGIVLGSPKHRHVLGRHGQRASARTKPADYGRWQVEARRESSEPSKAALHETDGTCRVDVALEEQKTEVSSEDRVSPLEDPPGV